MGCCMDILDTIKVLFFMCLDPFIRLGRCMCPKPKKSIKGEIVLLTGAGHGLGKEVARQLAELGPTLVLWDINQVRRSYSYFFCLLRLSREVLGCGSPVVRVSDHGRYVMSSSPVPLKTRRVGQRCTLNLSRAQTSSRWCGVVVRRGGCQLRCRPRHLTMVQNYVVRRQKPSCS
ncbi:uncharacterized protein TNCV_2880991 [Trichonephila clavipes]|nr:uncharacterized protein TNCV_2880991 [Trichonephila clavipes]